MSDLFAPPPPTFFPPPPPGFLERLADYFNNKQKDQTVENHPTYTVTGYNPAARYSGVYAATVASTEAVTQAQNQVGCAREKTEDEHIQDCVSMIPRLKREHLLALREAVNCALYDLDHPRLGTRT